MRALLICLLLLPIAAAAQDDRGFIQGLLEDALSAEGRSVRVEGFAGALSSRAEIERITVSDQDGIWLEIDNAALTWTRSALLSGRVEIDEIVAERLTLSRAPLPEPGALPSPTAPGRFKLPEFPVSLDLGRLEIAQVMLGASLLGEPVTLRVEGAAQLASGTGEADLAITRLDKDGAITLRGAFDNGSRVLGLDLSAREPAGGIAARQLGLPGTPAVALEISGTGPIDDYTADIRLATAGQDRLTGRVTLRGVAGEDQNFDATLSGDLAPVLAPEYRAFLGPEIGLAVSGARTSSGALWLDELTLRAQALQLTGSARIAPDGWPERFDLQGLLAGGAAPVLLPIPGPQTRVAGAEISAQFDAASGNRWVLRADLDGFDRPDLDITRLALNGDGVIDRAMSNVSGALVLDGAGIVPADRALGRALGTQLTGALRFDWQNGAPLSLSGITLGGADYGLQGAVSFDGISDDLNLRIAPDLRLQADDLSRFAALAGMPITGSALMQISGQVEPLAGLVDLTLGGETRDLTTGIAQLDPLLRGAGRLDARVQRDEGGTSLTPLRITSGAAQITAEGRLQPDGSTLRLEAALTDAGDVQPGLRGPASLTARAAQTGARWDVDATVTAPGDTVARFDGSVTGDGTAELLLDGLLTASVDRLSAYQALAGRPIGGALSLRAEGSGDALRRSFRGNARLNGTSLRSGLAQLDRLLVGPSRLTTEAIYSGDTLRFDRLALTATGLSLDASGSLSPTDGDVRLSTQIADLGRLVPDLPGPASLTGTARRAGGPWLLDVSGTGPGGIALSAQGRAAADASRFDMRLNGVAPLALANPRITPRTLAGLLNFDLALNGPPALSSLSGTLRTDQARVSLPTLRNAVSDIALTVQLAGARAQLQGTGRFDKGGALTLSGPIGLEPPFAADLSARVSNLDLEQTGLFETTANGTVTVSGALLNGAQIGGRIGLETVEARLPSFGPTYQALEGLRHVNPPADVLRTLQFAGLNADGSVANAAPVPSYPIDLLIDAPNRIFVRGRGLDAELGGAVRLLGTTDNLRPEGSFELIRGRLDLLGRRLVLTEGAVSLRGSFDPIIRLAASTDVEDTLITVAIEGAIDDPQLIIDSQPALPEEEALSLLLFGRELTSISPLQALQLAQAIRTLSGRGGGGVLEQVRTGLRIDDLDIGANAEGTAQARIGAYVSKNVYTDVTVTADGDSEINLNLDINDQLTIKGRLGSDGDTGIGLFFERDY